MAHYKKSEGQNKNENILNSKITESVTERLNMEALRRENRRRKMMKGNSKLVASKQMKKRKSIF